MREINADYQELIGFISDYRVSFSTGDHAFKEALKKMHKRYYAFLCLYHEVDNNHDNLVNIVTNNDNRSIFIERLREVLSELGTVFFVSIHGCYKTAKLVLRSCIENFAKAIGCFVDVNIVNEKSVYKVIDTALSHPVFVSHAVVEKNYLSEIYSNLCADVHTASSENMQQIECIGSFPVADINLFNEIAKDYIKLINTFTSVIIKICPVLLHRAHHKRMDAMTMILSAEDKRIIHDMNFL